jgi:pimeloyl-ACP methyl ester carboxylesterase
MWGSLPQITTAQLNSIRIPTTIAAGQYDEFIKPEHTRYIAAQIPGARLVILPNSSHFAMIQEPEAFSRAVLEFLAR